jgi:hypothetical protein
VFGPHLKNSAPKVDQKSPIVMNNMWLLSSSWKFSYAPYDGWIDKSCLVLDFAILL